MTRCKDRGEARRLLGVVDLHRPAIFAGEFEARILAVLLGLRAFEQEDQQRVTVAVNGIDAPPLMEDGLFDSFIGAPHRLVFEGIRTARARKLPLLRELGVSVAPFVDRGA